MVTVSSRRGGLLSLRNTWWVKVDSKTDKAKIMEEEMNNETSNYAARRTPLMQRYRNKTENSFWENHCALH